MTARNYSSTAAQTTLAAPINDSQTSLIVGATTGFPAVPYILAVDAGAVGQELVLVTAVAGTTLTITRGYDSTSAQSHLAGAVVVHSHAAIDLRDAATHQNASTGVHGAAGAVVGTTDAQTLTNKTLGSTNTLNGFTASKNVVTDATGKLVAGTSAVPTGTLVGTSDTQTLTNKDLSSGTNVFPGTLATDAEVTSAVSTHAALTATHGATGAVVGTTNTQTLTNKTLGAGTIVGAGTDISGAWTAYVPVWSSTTTAPAIGNGTIVGAYMQLGKTVLWRMRVTMGSTTTFGTGYYAWTLPPVTPISTQLGETIGVGTMLDSSTSQVFGGYTAAILTSTTFSLFNSAAARAAATAPTTFASGDVVSVYGSYEIA